MKIVHLSALPEDIALACPATLGALAKAGHQVVDVYPDEDLPHRAACKALEIDFVCSPLEKYLQEENWDILLSPSTQSLNPHHEAVGRLAREYIKNSVWWTWAIETTLRKPTLYYSFSQETLILLQKNLHHFKNAKIRRRLLRGRAEMVAALWGKGLWAEAFTESSRKTGQWRQSATRQLHPPTPLD